MKHLALILLAVAAPAAARTDITPYLEVGQIFDADLGGSSFGGDDVLTYTTVGAGIDASVQNRHAEGQLSYRYEHHFSYQKGVGDDDIHSGLARARADIVPGLSIEGAAVATRARADGGGAAPAIANHDSVAQVYGGYVGPTLGTKIGDLDVTAAYRLSYTKVDVDDGVVAPGVGTFDDATSHYAAASVGMRPGPLPFGWNVSGEYQRETQGQLDQRFEDKNVRGDLTMPVTPELALIGSVGYEKIQISERAPLVNAAGTPVTDAQGRLQTDPNSPRQLAYDFDGIIWDVGVLWRPTHHTSLEARVGRRYGSMSYTGSLTWGITENTGLQVGVYDEIESFSRQLNDNLVHLPTSFAVLRNPLFDNFGGCVFGSGAQTAGGTCLNDALQSIAASQFRARGVTAVLSTDRGRWSGGIAGGYSQRKFIAPTTGPLAGLNGVTDESWFADAYLTRKLDLKSSIETSLFATWYNPGVPLAPSTFTAGATAAYYRSLGKRLSATAALGLYAVDMDGSDDTTTASALLGLRYTF